MNKNTVKLLVAFVIFLGLGYYLGWLDNGPRNVNVESLPSRLDE